MGHFTNLLAAVFLIMTILTACKPGDREEPGIKNTPPIDAELTVFAAASLTEALTSVADAFQERYPGIKIINNFAGSQQLAQQLAQGAPADLFLSANQVQADAAVEASRADASEIVPFAGNRLVMILPPDNPGQVVDLGGLAKPGIKLILADPQVPVGAYTQEFLENASQDIVLGASYKQHVLDNVVSYEENVRAVLSKVILGEADAGIVYHSDALQAGADRVLTLPIPDELNVSALYYLVPVKDSSQPDLAGLLSDFILSTEGQDILASFGLTIVR